MSLVEMNILFSLHYIFSILFYNNIETVHEVHVADDTVSANLESYENNGQSGVPQGSTTGSNYIDAGCEQQCSMAAPTAYSNSPIYYPTGESGAILGPPFCPTVSSQQPSTFLG